MRTVTIDIHPGGDGYAWWAESDDMPGFTSTAATRERLIGFLPEDVAYYFDDDGKPTDIRTRDVEDDE